MKNFIISCCKAANLKHLQPFGNPKTKTTMIIRQVALMSLVPLGSILECSKNIMQKCRNPPTGYGNIAITRGDKTV